nr:MAG TPA: hypothetical protein [Caudoviricetes sp.]DAN66186.1 MAG TPA: hypothetical protein [Caudoviricetes sp.]DAO43677.1 MAG TPA: hypothetical protein [Caudoviricetes sp.]DAR26182.1 MAG TPA: hypothetical protein [Caudoviricetes sp.]DAY00627.1 MAG TPA: hypothetical protein [Caudoviricetes sp.]
MVGRFCIVVGSRRSGNSPCLVLRYQADCDISKNNTRKITLMTVLIG